MTFQSQAGICIPEAPAARCVSLWNDPDMLFGFLVWFGALYICLNGIRLVSSDIHQKEPDGFVVQWVYMCPSKYDSNEGMIQNQKNS